MIFIKMLKWSEVTQLCLTLCGAVDCSLPGSSVHGIFQARVLEWVAISFSNAWKWKVQGKSLSRVWLVATPWTAAHQAPPSMGFSRQEYWSGVSLPSPAFWLAVYFTHSHGICQCYSLNSSPSLGPHIRSLWLSLYSCPANSLFATFL